MQTFELNVMIKAPVERCFRLALSPELARDAMDGWRSEREAEERRTLGAGDVLRWGAQRRIRSMGEFAETLTEVRARTLIRRSFTGPAFAWGEERQHFASMNDGTWLRNELRFAARQGMWAGIRDRRLRRALRTMVTARGLFLKSVAEGSGWMHYLPTEEAMTGA